MTPVLSASSAPLHESQWQVVNPVLSASTAQWRVVKPEFCGRVAPATIQVAGSKIELSARVAVKLVGSKSEPKQ